MAYALVWKRAQAWNVVKLQSFRLQSQIQTLKSNHLSAKPDPFITFMAKDKRTRV